MFSVVDTTGMSEWQVQEYWTLLTVNTGYSGVGNQEGRRVGEQINYWNRRCLDLLNYVQCENKFHKRMNVSY
jgi:hypothetical protein